MKRLDLYTLDVNYVAELAKADSKVMSVSPQQKKDNRPFVGVVVICNDKRYCIPLTSPKPKHQKMKDGLDFSRLFDNKGKLLGAMNFNNMIPVDDRLIKKIYLLPLPTDSPQEIKYKDLLNDQLDWCNNNRKEIKNKASRLYEVVTIHHKENERIVSRCCDFKKLEAALEKYLIDQGLEQPKQEYIIKKVSEDEFNALKSSGMNFQTAIKDNQRVIRFKTEQKEQVEKIINGLKNKNVLL
ncbi:type III toxin-antitoxin system ToxN/AbiQ family toxin [Ruminococcus flavefaciens]|uniref:type III toxin-antitoxin system ToxN/AbiQ family toxin n=1 Tax=Ruminococcus flavefaciens TaxID=1265 RepID=UPI0026F1CC84|nr:type III toxin-antitoxin system ToxN/AbiQ family toxin [Ruminococcus flavefaciens]